MFIFLEKSLFKSKHKDAETHQIVGKKILISNTDHFAHGFLAEIVLFSDDTRTGFAKAKCFSMFVSECDFVFV